MATERTNGALSENQFCKIVNICFDFNRAAISEVIAHARIDAVLSNRPAPTCSKCGNTLGCVSCYNETANETREYRHHVLCSGDRRFPAGDPGHSCSCFELNPPPAERMFTVEQMREVGRKFQWEHTVEKIIAALDPPKPVLLCSHLFSRDPMVVCDRKLGHLGPCAPDNGADTLKAQAELAKERP